ncbi:MAG: ATP-binding protein [Candidatus Pelethousia sp.]|nr:ATP-binding protein [Candidatus Pelethousia sp.]
MKEISLHILDLAQNSLHAGAKNICLDIEEDTQADTFAVTLADDGCGMSESLAQAAANPFVTTRTTRRVGLGIPMFKAGCEACGGSFTLTSEEGKGTRLKGVYRHSHIDRPPLGGICDTMLLLIAGNPTIRFRYSHRRNGSGYELDTAELKEILGEVPLDTPEVTAFIKEFLINNESELYGGR